MSNQKNFARGINIKSRNFGYLSLGVKKEDFVNWLCSINENEKGYINLTIGEKKEVGKYGETHYMCEDTWKPESRNDNPDFTQADSGSLRPEAEDNEDLPF